MDTKDKWLAQQLRISIFPEIGILDSSKDLWPKSKKIGLDNENIDKNAGIKTYEGNFANFKLALAVSPIKIDLVFFVALPFQIDKNNTQINTIGTFRESINIFSEVSAIWFKDNNFPKIIRLAFGANLIKSAESKKDAYAELAKYVPLEINPEKMSDFNLRMNLFKPSKIIDKLIINRLSTWNSLTITPELALIGAPHTVKMLPPKYISHVELDINTSQENKEAIDENKVLELYDELINNAIEVSEKGLK